MGAMAQKERVRNQPYADLKWLHLGFHVGIHSQDLLLTHTGVMTNGETWFAEIPSYSPGFSVGVIGDMYMNPYFNLRFTPSIHFGDKKFKFREQATGEEFITNVRSSYLNFPLDVTGRSNFVFHSESKRNPCYNRFKIRQRRKTHG